MNSQQDEIADLRTLFLVRTAELGEQLAYAVVQDDLGLAEQRSFGALRAEVLELADALADLARPGERVLLAFDHHGGLEAVRLFWASLVAGLVPVPAPAPGLHPSRAALVRLPGMLADARARLVVAMQPPGALQEATPGTHWWTPAQLRERTVQKGAALARQAAQPAYLQYTSGSTSEPRGVMLDHAAVLAHGRAIRAAAVAQVADPRGLSWLPWFHDYGLVQGVIQPMLEGAPSYLMSTLSFMRHPLRWLEAIDRHRITHSGAPDFAYASCVQALGRQPGWQARLAHWEVASCGAEPVRARTLRAFTAAFAPHGFRASAFRPAYGLAEAVLVVSLHRGGEAARVARLDAQALARDEVQIAAEDAPRAQEVVGCGEPLPGVRVCIVDPALRRPCPATGVGEIWLAGPSVAAGYWGRPQDTAEVFRARLDDGSGDDTPWLRTGDLGFLHDGELFVTGRRKDLIVVHGRNLYPQDLERTAEAVDPMVRGGGVMAFGVAHAQGEGVVLLLECRGHPPAQALAGLVARVHRQVAIEHEVEVRDVVAVRAGSLPRTSSGKPQRALARERYLAGEWPPLARSGRDAQAGPGPRDAIELAVASAWEQVTGIAPADVHADFFRLGGSSLTATQWISRVNAALSTALPIRAAFEAPTVATLAAQIRQVAAGEAEGGDETIRPDAIPHVQEGDLSPAQKRMWFLHALAPDSAAYHMPLAVRLRGSLQAQALQQACRDVVERHAILRTRFVQGEGQVQARVAPAGQAGLEWSQESLPAGDENALARRVRELGSLPFDLAQGPLLRVNLLALGPQDHLLLLVMHHIIGDQWSFAVLARDLAAAYAHRIGARAAPPAQAALPYAAYAAAHGRWLTQAGVRGGSRLDAQLAYWRQRLQGLEPVGFPEDHPRPAQQGWRGARVRLPLDTRDMDALTAQALRHGATLPMALLALLKVLLMRHSGRHDLAVGMPIANRHHLAAEALIGPLVNTLVVRTDLSGTPDLAAVLARVREAMLEAFAHQDLPFEEIVQALGVVRDPARSPLFSVLFNVVNTPVDALARATATGGLDFPGLAWQRLDFDRGAVQFDLTVTADLLHEPMLTFEYATDLYEAASIERLAAQFGMLVRAAVAELPGPVAHLPILPPDQVRQLEAWARGLDAAPPRATLQGLVEQLPASWLPRVAAVEGEVRCTYGELRRRVRRLAHALRARGLGCGARVAYCLPRGVGLLVAQLGVLHSGAAGVPLDPDFPLDRLQYMLRDARVSLLVTQAEVMERLGWPRADGLLLDQDAAELAVYPDAPLAADAHLDARPEDPAYLMYTSGSTGQPKAVVVPHRAVVSFLGSMVREPGLHEQDVLLAVTTPSFDISVLELWGPLMVGARIVIARRDDVRDARALLALMQSQGVTVMQATPATWRMLLEAGWEGRAGALSKALVGGEALAADLADALCARVAQVWNLYGPTETTVWSAVWRVEPGHRDGVAIGRPIDRTVIRVIDGRGQVCPVGAPGEIWIGGAGLAQGYFDRPALTAERFVADPVATGERLYRTGDRGRWRHDGLLQHLGRLDEQFKLRGHRIEPGEIEVMLRRHPDVSQALVALLGPQDAGEPLLVAYIVPRGSGLPDGAALRAHLSQTLPDYMLPQRFVHLDSLPVLPNGKVDRSRLPRPEPAAARAPRIAPRNRQEHVVWAIWRDVLRTEAFGVEDDFFDLGGHSMLAVQVVQRIREELRGDCTLPLLFQHTTVASLAAALQAYPDIDTAAVLPLQAQGTGPRLYGLAGIHLFQELADALGRTTPMFGAFVPSELAFIEADATNGAMPLPTVEAMAAEYVQLLRRQHPGGPYRLAGHCFGALLAFEAARQLHQAGEAVDALVLLDPPLVRPPARRRWSATWRRAAARRWSGWRRGEAEASAQAGPADGRLAPVDAARSALYEQAALAYRPQEVPVRAVVVWAGTAPAADATGGWGAVVGRCERPQGRAAPSPPPAGVKEPWGGPAVPCEVWAVEGDHLGMLQRPRVQDLGRRLQAWLADTPASEPATPAGARQLPRDDLIDG